MFRLTIRVVKAFRKTFPTKTSSNLSDVLEQERKRLQHSVLHVQLGHAVLVHQGGKDGERGARLGDDRYGDGGAHAVLPLLHLQVVEQRCQDVVGPDGLGDVTESVDGRSPD